jgi:hypothetical protein
MHPDYVIPTFVLSSNDALNAFLLNYNFLPPICTCHCHD